MTARGHFALVNAVILGLALGLSITSCGGGSGAGGGGGGSAPPPPPNTANEWAWMGGSSKVNAAGVYGVQGVPAAANVPGARSSAVSWTDSSGNFWLFGGNGLASGGTQGLLNDLWEFSASTKQWTWMSGGSAINPTGVYGSLAVPAASNVPPGLAGAVSWIDGGGNLWLFGGDGYASDGHQGLLNDLWEFDPAIKEWTWMSGSSKENPAGVYGSEGVPAAANVPGGRDLAVSWIDSSGNLWFLGGFGVDEAMAQGLLNDLWEFSPATKEWAWMGGSYLVGGQSIYGTMGVPAEANRPGGRSEAVGWTDSGGNFWLFGGDGFADYANGAQGLLNDLWEFSPSTKEWAWISGSSAEGAAGSYGTLGVANAANLPPGLAGAVGWIDGDRNLWLLGGGVNALWEFNPSIKEWTWMGGSSTANAAGVYGVLGTPAAASVPGARSSAVGWIDDSGNLWLFGGLGDDSSGTGGSLNDLWRYEP